MESARSKKIDDFGPGAWLIWAALAVAVLTPSARSSEADNPVTHRDDLGRWSIQLPRAGGMLESDH